ncbi:MAG TPA: squalene synthase HpnC [Acidimicrobiales bacterium]|nr:squalene synthase HpnC [Acidimicrobiales bacterium]
MSTATTEAGRSLSAELPPPYMVLGRSAGENFPVASRLLPPELRADLMALYGWARLVDELGDNFAGDRLGALDEVERQLRACLEAGAGAGAPPGTYPLVARMAETVRRRALPVQPLYDLAQANRQDQAVHTYATLEELVGYCRLSADPVGRMVLAIFGVTTPERVAWSDRICTALQLIEHWQDVAEDAIVGRIYVPREDLARFGIKADELVPPPVAARGWVPPTGAQRASWGSSAECRALMAFECARARRMLESGEPLVASVKGRLRVAIAGFVAGGHAALDALAAIDFDIYADTARPSPRRVAFHMARLLAAGATGRTASGDQR